jgi:hypothetical protein
MCWQVVNLVLWEATPVTVSILGKAKFLLEGLPTDHVRDVNPPSSLVACSKEIGVNSRWVYTPNSDTLSLFEQICLWY